MRFKLGVSMVQSIIIETCDIIWDVLQPVYMPEPTRQDWINISNQFYTRWNFPNCLGALDGKHIIMTAPAKSGSLFYNYKGSFSVNLMALVDADYKFMYIDIGNYGSNVDGQVLKKSKFGKAYMNGELDVPPPTSLPNYPDSGPVPYCIVADEAFLLTPTIMRPFPRTGRKKLQDDERIFNYRLSRVRRIVKNAFGILAQRWLVFSRRLPLMPENVDRVVKACCVLPNYLRGHKSLVAMQERLNLENQPYLGEDVIIIDLDNTHGYRSANVAHQIRNLFKEYFNGGLGSVPWQRRATGV